MPIADLHPALEGFRVLHLSDFHLGTLSLNGRTLEKAVAWAGKRELDLVVVTGDLLSRRRGDASLRAALGDLRARYGVYAVLGNHDIAETRDPFSEPGDPSAVMRAGATLLSCSVRVIEVGGASVQIVGVDPASFARREARPAELADREADFRLLLCHFPDIVHWLPRGAFELTLAGHLHGGQICLPTPGGKLRLEHLRAPYWEGLHRTGAGWLHVSRGLGTSFVPFRLLARPEATLLTLEREH